MSNIIEKPYEEITGEFTPVQNPFIKTGIILDELEEGLKAFMPKPYTRLPRKKKKMLYKSITITIEDK